MTSAYCLIFVKSLTLYIQNCSVERILCYSGPTFGRLLMHDDCVVDQNIVLCFVYFMIMLLTTFFSSFL